MPMTSGVASATSKSITPSWTFLTRSSPPTTSAPASIASRSFSPVAKTAIRRDLAGAVRQRDGAPHHLVGVARVDAEADVRLDRRIELRGRGLADEAHRLGGRVELPVLDRRSRPRGTSCRVVRAFHCLRGVGGRAAPSHSVAQLTFRPMDRAVPSMILVACSRSCALRSACLTSAISRTCCLDSEPTFVAVRVSRALLDARRPSSAARPRAASW